LVVKGLFYYRIFLWLKDESSNDENFTYNSLGMLAGDTVNIGGQFTLPYSYSYDNAGNRIY